MAPKPFLPDEGTLTVCTWCGERLGQTVMPRGSAIAFCSRRCEIEANFWLYQEMCVIEITDPLQSTREDPCDSP
jgi:endogenous inhibitor of DNA gyrase (YacG/DUF329 family)